MDIQMPVMDGIEATQVIRSLDDVKKANVPIIALTANALKGNENIYVDAGMNASVTKPYTEQKLFSTVNAFFNGEENITITDVAINYEDKDPISTAHEKLYDLVTINKLGNNNVLFAKSLLKMFIDKVPNDVAKMVNLCKEENWEEIAFVTHKLKASIQSLNITKVKSIVAALEEVDKHSMLDRIAIESLINEFKNYIDIVVSQMKEELSTM
jgi:CheY-like chemotaxis protein